MKKIFLLPIALISVFALSGCVEDDGGDLAGSYVNKEKNEIILDYKKPDYEVSYIQYDNFSDSLGVKDKYLSPKLVGVMKKDGGYLVDGSGKKMFEIQSNGVKTLYTEKAKVFLKKGN